MDSIKKAIPAWICFFLTILVFTSRLSTSIKSISLFASLLLIICIIPFKHILKTSWKNPVARAAILLYMGLLIGSLYGNASFAEKVAVLKNYLPLLWIGIVITFFNMPFNQLNKRFTTHKAQTYSSVFLYAVTLIALLGCINAWHIIDIAGLVHHRIITDPPEYPFGTFSFSISFAAFLSLQKFTMSTKPGQCYRYLACFLFLSFFLFFMNHQRTAYVLYFFLLALYGYQHLSLKGMVGLCGVCLLLVITAYSASSTFHARTISVVRDVQLYYHGNPASSTGLRLFFLKTSYHLWKEKPLLGYGTGSFKKTYLKTNGYNIIGEQNTEATALDQPHSDYAYFLVQLGLMGFLLLLYLLFQQWKMTYRLPMFEKYCAQGLVLGFVLSACDTTLLFYATSMTDYFFFTALFYASMPRKL